MRLKNKPLFVFCSVVIGLVVVWVLYFLFAKPFIQAMYEGRLFGPLNKIIEQQDKFPLTYFFDKAHGILVTVTLNILLCLFFVTTLYLWIKALVVEKITKAHAALLAIFTIISFTFAEYSLRQKGYLWVWREHRNPLMHKRDNVLGWTQLPGQFFIKGYSDEQDDFYMTFWEDGSRVAGPKRNTSRKKIIFLGDSVTYGGSIADDQTFAWKLQQRFPSVQINNLAIGAWGTYQNLMRLERYFENHKTEGPLLVVYAYTSFQQDRNVAPARWLKILTRANNTRDGKQIGVPFCYLNKEGEVVRGGFAYYTAWPLREKLAIVHYLENQYNKLRTAYRDRNHGLLTKKLILKMRELCDRHNAQLLVVGIIDDAGYLFEESDSVETLDCTHPDFVWGDLRFSVKGEGHPNEYMNDYWADCMEKRIGEFVRS